MAATRAIHRLQVRVETDDALVWWIAPPAP
jgi:hypothetical protein